MIDLQSAAASLGVALSDTAASKLVQFETLVRRWNEKVNLVSRRDIDRLRERHVLDSLSLINCLPETAQVCMDVGSGAGFPGMVLAVADSRRQWCLLDRAQRKARFLSVASRDLELENVEVRCEDVGALAADPAWQSRFDVVTSRAVAPLDVLWSMCQPMLAQNGVLLHMTRARSGSQSDGRGGDAVEASDAQEAQDAPAVLDALKEMEDRGFVSQHRVNIPGLVAPHVVTQVTNPAASGQ